MADNFKKQIKVKNKDGIHARPSVKVVEVANQFSSDIYIKNSDLTVNSKSILDVLTLSACYGTELIVEAVGSDAKEAVEAVSNLLGTEFHFPQQETKPQK